MLELDEGQLSRPVLRGGGGGNATSLPGIGVKVASRQPSTLPEALDVLREMRRGTPCGGQFLPELWIPDATDSGPRVVLHPGFRRGFAHGDLRRPSPVARWSRFRP